MPRDVVSLIVYSKIAERQVQIRCNRITFAQTTPYSNQIAFLNVAFQTQISSLPFPTMKPSPISFFKQDVAFRLNKKEQLYKWITSAAKKEGFDIIELNYVFCTDPYLKKMNVKFLKHNYFTDIITFDNSIEKKKIIGDIFISIDRIRINAKQYETTFDNELHRVMIHGLLHLTGYKDKTPKDQQVMRKMEDLYLSKWKRS